MSAHPSRAYYTNSWWLMAPTFYNGSLEDYVSYKNLDKKILSYAPKYPSNINLNSIKADYLIYDTALKNSVPQYSFLFDKNSDKVPKNFKLIYYNPEVVVYKIIKYSK